VRFHDISRPLDPSVWVWPGDTPFDCALSARIADGASVNVGRFTMSCHAGTHMDAPFHFSDSGATSERIPLAHCVGPCEVLPLARLADSTAERVLVKAGGQAPSAAEIDALGRHLLLFGTDHHSVDPMDSKTLDAHHALWRMGAVILEELDLSAVPDGRYELIALPLKLVGMDGAPVRAVLVER
jgi:arylformamidase